MQTAPAVSPGSLPRDLDSHILTLLTKISNLKDQHQSHMNHHHHHHRRRSHSMSVEVWSLELWRAVAVECFATFLFSFIIIAASITTYYSIPYPGSVSTGMPGTSITATALATGLAIAAVQLIFGPISGKCLSVQRCNLSPLTF